MSSLYITQEHSFYYIISYNNIYHSRIIPLYYSRSFHDEFHIINKIIKLIVLIKTKRTHSSTISPFLMRTTISPPQSIIPPWRKKTNLQIKFIYSQVHSYIHKHIGFIHSQIQSQSHNHKSKSSSPLDSSKNSEIPLGGEKPAEFRLKKSRTHIQGRATNI